MPTDEDLLALHLMSEILNVSAFQILVGGGHSTIHPELMHYWGAQ